LKVSARRLPGMKRWRRNDAISARSISVSPLDLMKRAAAISPFGKAVNSSFARTLWRVSSACWKLPLASSAASMLPQ
jgi:hypothetical protein